MRLSVRLSATLLSLSLLAAPEGAAAQGPIPRYDPYADLRVAAFSAPTATFFTGDVTRAVYHGCHWTETCITAVYEIGIERATGVGAARSLMTRQSWNRPHSDPRVTYLRGVDVWAPYYADATLWAPSAGPPGWRPPAIFLLGGVHDRYPGEWIARNVVGGIQWETAELGGIGVQELRVGLWLTETDPGCPYPGQQYCTYQDALTARRQSVEQFNADATLVTPEPSTYALLGTGLLTLGGIAARRRRAV